MGFSFTHSTLSVLLKCDYSSQLHANEIEGLTLRTLSVA